MSDTVRIGIIGAGAIAGAYASAFDQSIGGQLTAVADVNRDAAAAVASSSNATVFTDHAALLESGLCDAVIVSTPPSTHEAIVLDAIERGIPVLCEKPFAIEGDSARRIAAAARTRNLLVAMASKFRHVEDFSRAQDMLVNDDIGELRLVENVFTGTVDMVDRWNAQKEISGGGVLIDNGTHSVDIIRALAGPIVEMSATAGPRLQAVDVEDHVFAFGRTSNGVLAQIETSWSLHKDRTHYIELSGTDGTIQLGWQKSRVREGRIGAWTEFGTGYGKVAAFAGQIDSFVAAVRGDHSERLGGLEDAIASVDAISAGYASMAENGRWVAVDEVVSRPRLELLAAVS